MLKDWSSSWRARHWPTTMLATTLWLAGTCAHATIYRCELPTGIRYQQQACEGGRSLDTTDHRTKAQHQDSTQATKTAAKLGKQLERDRRRQEKATAGQRPIAMDDPKRRGPVAAPSPQVSGSKRKRPFTAKVPKDKGHSAKSS